MSYIHLDGEPSAHVVEDQRASSSTMLAPTAVPTSIHRHVSFWDKSNKGYITPLDTISGFITLGYGVVFSVALGSMMGIFLSVSTQSGWIPDPLCRSNVAKIVHVKESSQHAGAYDVDGSFNPKKFDLLFNKYAKTDKSHQTITITELMRMTREQENLGRNMKAWAASMMELCTVYFFTGHKGTLSKEDVQSAYDGSFFYRLRDKNKLLIQGKQQPMDSRPLNGKYLSRSSSVMNIRDMEYKVQVLLSSLQSKQSAAAKYGVPDLLAYVQETASTLKDRAVPQSLKRSPSRIDGVKAPKSMIFKESTDLELLNPSLEDYMGLSLGSDEVQLLSSFAENFLKTNDFQRKRHVFSSSDLDNTADNYRISRNLLREETEPSITHSPSLVSFVHDDDWTNNSTSSLESDTDDTVGMSGFLRRDDEENLEKLPPIHLTGVHSEEKGHSDGFDQGKDAIDIEKQTTATQLLNHLDTDESEQQLRVEQQENLQGSLSRNSSVSDASEESSAQHGTSQGNDQYSKDPSSFVTPPLVAMPPSPPQTFDESNDPKLGNKDTPSGKTINNSNKKDLTAAAAPNNGKASRKKHRKNKSRRTSPI